MKTSTVQPVFCLLIITLFLNQQSFAARILSLSFVSSKSHKITYEPLLYELAQRGHHVTILSPYISGKNLTNIREILTIDVDKAFDNLPNIFEMKENNEQLGISWMAEHFGAICSSTYELPQVHELAKEKFDLIILQPLFNECTAGFIHSFNTSLLLITPALAPPFITSNFGNPSPPSFVPSMMGAMLSDQMNFYQRVINFLTEAGLRLGLALMYKPHMDGIYRKALSNPNLPSSDEVFGNASLILTNSHFSLNQPKPFLPDIIEVGGMHCRPAKPLPKDLDDYLNSSGSDGFIYFSMGSALKGSTMPEHTRQIFINVFSKLKQKVLWKWETEHMDDLPKNVKLSKWLPQQDILGHPKIKVFITHGGFGGTTEAVYHGVPLIGIPMFGDQIMNMKKAEAAGFVVNIEYNDLSEEKLLNAINEILTQTKYRETVQHLSKLFRDQPTPPLQRAVYWTEYVIKHGGATHLRSAARELNFIQYHSLDVILTLLGLISLACLTLFIIIRAIVRKIFGKNAKQLTKTKKLN